MFALYEVLLYLVFILAFPWFLIIGLLRGKYLANLRERLGRYPTPKASHDLWIHAVSVGETMATRPVIDRILARRPETTVVITTTTITGQALAHRLYPGFTRTYFPLDFSFVIRRFLDHHSPRVFATLETELWPNAARIASARGIRLLLANGRISDRSLPRYRLIRPLIRPVLSLFDRVLVRDEIDRTRFEEIGAPPDRLEVCGNIKFDLALEERTLAIEPRFRELVRERPVFVAGSTIEGEDEILVPRLSRLIRDTGCFVILAPRKPERFEIVAGLLTASEIAFVRRSEIDQPGPPVCDVLLLDSIGELAAIYRYAHVAFVGGSLLGGGGHNPIEPAAAGVPVAFGPYMSNFREIASTFVDEGVAVTVRDVEELCAFVARMLGDETARKRIAEKGVATVNRNRGAAQRTADRILELLG